MKIFKYLVVAAVALFTAACTESPIDDLTGVYPAPDNYVVNSATDQGVTKEKNLRTFAVDFTTAKGDVLSMKFVGDAYYLPSAAYTPAEAAKARKGNYIVGPDGSTFTKAGGSATEVLRGVVNVTRDDDNYTLKGTMWLADGTVVKVTGSCTLVYEPDPTALEINKVLSYANNVPNGTNTVTLNLGTDGVEAVDNGYGGVAMSGSGNYLAVDFYSADGSLEPGTYYPTESGQEAPFTYVKGWDPGDLWGIGWVFENWGTCWWTVDGANATAVHIETGSFEVKKSGSTYTITYNDNGLFIEFKGVIEGMGGSQGGNEPSYDIQLTKVLSAQSNVGNGTNSVTLNLGTDDLATAPNAWGGVDITGSGNYLAVDLYSADGTIAAGTYTPADNSALAPFTYVKGWDPGDLWGIGMVFENWGTCWWTVEDGVATAKHIESGDIKVDYDGGVFTISYAAGDLSFQFKGEIPGIEGVGGGNSETPSVEYIEISNFLSAAVNNGTTLSLQLGGDGITTTPNAWGGVDLAGDGNYLKIDLYTTDGTLAEGTYTPVDNTALAEGTFAKGYDGEMWGMTFPNWGTCWMTRSGDTETGVKVEDGTITVKKSGDNYVITLTSTAANVRYTGPISL